MTHHKLLTICIFFLAHFAVVADTQTMTAITAKPVAPEFALKDMDGKVHQLKDYRGKVVIVNFWATWCPPCRREMPSMERAWKQLQDQGVVMLAINVGEDIDTVFTFLADYPVSFPLLFDKDSSVSQSWQMRGLPTTYVVDTRGRLVYQAIGGREWDDPGLLKVVLDLRTSSGNK